MTRTSLTDALYVNWCDPLPVPGRLGMTFAPGKWDPAPRSGPAWDRDLGLDLDRLRDEYRLDRLVSLVEDRELRLLRIERLVPEAAARGIEVVRFPIVDGGVPADLAATQTLVRDLVEQLRRASRVAVHCRGGLGRAGTITACTLVALGRTPEEAIREVRRAREGAIEYPHQEAFVRAWR